MNMFAPLSSFLFNLFGSPVVRLNCIPVVGDWSERVSSPPDICVKGDTLYLYYTDSLVDLNICIMRGCEKLYEETISSNNGDYMYVVPWKGEPDNYWIEITHMYGSLKGPFRLE